ncbi:MAG: hypothetical protein R3C02_17500, partial [Planctomycetaceae bacterium]
MLTTQRPPGINGCPQPLPHQRQEAFAKSTCHHKSCVFWNASCPLATRVEDNPWYPVAHFRAG